MHNSDVQQYRIDHVPLQKSIYKREDGEYRVQHDDIYQRTTTHAPHTKPYPNPTYTTYPKPPKHNLAISTYNKDSQKWWSKLFGCCNTVDVQPDFQDCDYCQRRVYKNDSDSQEDVPYISHYRMKQRQQQPINTFCDKLDNNQLVKNNWQSE